MHANQMQQARRVPGGQGRGRGEWEADAGRQRKAWGHAGWSTDI